MPRRWLAFKKNSLPIVSVHLRGEQYRALLDTGAGISFIEPQLALELGLPKVGQYLVYTLGRQIACRTVNLPPLNIAGLQLPSCLAAVDRLSMLQLDVQFILGINAFLKYRLSFDFPAARVYIID